MQQATLQAEKIIPGTIHDPSKIMQTGMGFWASKVLLSAVKLRLFTVLAGRALKGSQIRDILKLQTTQRHVYDWLDALVSLGFLKRDGLLDEALYTNTPDSNYFLDQNKMSYLGGMLEMSNNRLYGFWSNLEDALLTGLPQNESKGAGNGNSAFSELYSDTAKIQEFMDAMSGIQMANFMVLASEFNFSNYSTMADIGGADASLSIQVCRRHQDIVCTTFDLPQVAPIAARKISQFNLDNRIEVIVGDFMEDPLPEAKVITMGNILHGLNEENKQFLLNKIYRALPKNGVLIVIENVIDNERRQNSFGLLMSLNMLIENGDAFDYTLHDFEGWAGKVGFKKVEIMPLTGPASAIIAYK
jgi:ubiquinone/menaquinone biosynthesis C-methylase UbiE